MHLDETRRPRRSRLAALLLLLVFALAACTLPPVAGPAAAPVASATEVRAPEAASPPAATTAAGSATATAPDTGVTAAAAPDETPAGGAGPLGDEDLALEATAGPAGTATRESVVVKPTRTPAVAASATAAAAGVAATPSATASAGSEVIPAAQRGATTYRVSAIALPAYPYASLLAQTTDPDLAGYPVFTLDRPAYEAGNPQPAPRTYRLLVLENRYLRLGILPDLGGRIYECVFKPTGANEFYSNPVIKPTQWGPPAPAGASWWLAAGGLEWGFPVEEHGYEFGTVWGFDHAAQPDGGVMITVFTKTGPQAPYAVVDIILPPDTAYFILRPHIVNPLGAPFRFKWWANAMLAPGPANSASADLRIILPVSEVTVHSTGDPGLPAPGQGMSWPVAGGRDLSRLGAWQNYAGLFARPDGAGLFAGVYDPTADEGMVRVPGGNVAKGLKVFAPRGADGLDPALWTDDGSTYIELHAGLTATFDDWYELEPGHNVTWDEYWYPVAGIGGVTFASEAAAVSLIPAANSLQLGVFPTAALSGTLTIVLPGAGPLTLDAQMSPEEPFVRELLLGEDVASQGQVAISLVDRAGATVFEWQGAAQLR